jgi:hypothetical protein
VIGERSTTSAVRAWGCVGRRALAEVLDLAGVLNVLNPISRHWSRLALVSTCGVLIAALLGCGRVTAQSNKISGYRAGFSGGGHILWESDAELNRDFDSMKATGAKWVRIDVDWKSIQSSGPGSWNWS